MWQISFPAIVVSGNFVYPYFIHWPFSGVMISKIVIFISRTIYLLANIIFNAMIVLPFVGD